MKRQKPSWLKGIPIDPSKLTLDEIRSFKEADRLLTGPIEGPEGWVYFVRCFWFLTAFAMATIADNRLPPLTRCWNELHKFFMHDKVVDDEMFVQSWIFFNFPVDKKGQTVLDYFDDFLTGTEGKANFQYFIEQMKKSRLGLYQEILSSKEITKFRELVTGKVINTFRCVEEYEKGEIFLTRLVECQGQVYQFGNPRCWPNELKSQIEGFTQEKLLYFSGSNTEEKYIKLMELGGPYWMSCVTSNPDFPILEPDHYLRYFKDR